MASSVLRGFGERVARLALTPELLFRAYLLGRTGTLRIRPRPPRQAVNLPLLSNEAWQRALASVKQLRLAPHDDGPKNWDALACLDSILSELPASAAVLDAGAASYSPLLRWLYLYGYRDLHGINLVFDRPFACGPIRYIPGDILSTPYPDARFDAITCLSVIDHGVDEERFFKEMRRIVKPGGLLLVSCDYFADPTPTTGLTAYGVPVRVFDREQIQAQLRLAQAHGFVPTSTVELDCAERIVSWKRMNIAFTFLLLAFRRSADPSA